MKLTQMIVTDYLDLLKSDAPAPGGGSVSALTGAQGLALLLMVADLTISRPKYEMDHPLCIQVKETALPLYEAMVEAVDRDTDAYNKLSAAFKFPKETETQKADRSKAIAEANLEATEVPFSVMKLATKGLELVEKLVNHSNPNAASDLGVAAACLETAAKGAWLNVSINLSGVKDPDKAQNFETKGKEMYQEAVNRAGHIVETIR